MEIALVLVLSLARALASAALVLALAGLGYAQLAPADAARLGNDLTPLGGEKAGNPAGTIPAWDGGITKPPAGYRPGMRHPDPFAGDAVRFTIAAANLAEHAAHLTAGHKALLEVYPTFKMNVYPTRRSASAPPWIYEATRRTAATARLVGNGNGVEHAVNGIPFPVPRRGCTLWNHLLRYRGEAAQRHFIQAAPTRGGQEVYVPYNASASSPSSSSTSR